MELFFGAIGFLTVLLVLFMQWQVYVGRIVLTFAVSSFIIAFGFLYQGLKEDQTGLMVLAGLTAAIRGIVIPLLVIRGIHRKPARAREERPVVQAASSILIALALVVFGLLLFELSIGRQDGFTNHFVSIPFAVLLQGGFLIMSRRNAFIQMTGYLVIENAVLLFGVWGFPELPLLIEGAVVLDLIGIVAVSRIVMRMREITADTTGGTTEELKG